VGKHVLSQWWPASFTVDGNRYPTAEHYMMAEKARLFGDEDARRRMLSAKDPAAAKSLGRRVENFGTGDLVLVEASPRDTIWGIGLSASNERALDSRTWRGLNLLGFALMKARAELRLRR
jgi:predicted NAD-dependent protein-ADP-ribosyltransferase YbiA (DUF1768 family)